MIPTIETIVEDLLAGTITKQQAIALLHQHAEDAYRELRDEIAVRALQGLLAAEAHPNACGFPNSFDDGGMSFAQSAYTLADTMLKARGASRE